MLIYGGDIWPIGPTEKIGIDQLFFGLLLEEVCRDVVQAGIAFYTLYSEDILPQNNYRIEKTPHGIKDPPMRWGGKFGDRLVYSDYINKGVSAIGGNRFTINNPKTAKNSVYIFGPCLIRGAFSEDCETVPSKLQALINNGKFRYRVINCGIGDADCSSNINLLYALMEYKYLRNDIIIFLVPYSEDITGRYSYNKCYPALTCFREWKYRWKQTHHDAYPLHANRLGNEIIAKHIYSLIGKDLALPSLTEDNDQFVFPERTYLKVKDYGLDDYLAKLSSYDVGEASVGAVVMNCNPFTRGHEYLIDQARRRTEYLFVFVVEEDLSDVSFDDRFAIAQSNCKEMENVTVLPSGKI